MKKRTHIFGAAFLAVGILSLAGCASTCASTSYIPYQTSPTAKVGSAFGTHVEVTNVGGMIKGRVMHGQATLTNKTDVYQTVRYHFVWTTPNGVPQGENTPWIPLGIGPNFSQTVQSVAPNSAATNFELQICQ